MNRRKSGNLAGIFVDKTLIKGHLNIAVQVTLSLDKHAMRVIWRVSCCSSCGLIAHLPPS